MSDKHVAVIGGGLAGCECAVALARSGVAVTLFEMRPERATPAHTGGDLAELVCSNSLRSDEPSTGVGVLKAEMRDLGSVVMEVAEATRVPAGKALAVDRELFAARMTEAVAGNDSITLERREIASLDDPAFEGMDAVVVAAGPLASDALSGSLAETVGEYLYFYDAIAPIVSTESVDTDIAFWASRWKPEEKDYLNCPMDEAQYNALRQALLDGDTVKARDFEKEIHFEGCMPVETLAERGDMTLAFGPLKPVGLTDPRTGEQAFAVLQLRPENADRTSLNLVGCQTKLTYPEQDRIFRMVPGLANVEFLRYGSMHRNTYVNAPRVLTGDLELKNRPGVFLAGQITGVEGYVESAACGLWVGHMLAARLAGRTIAPPPETSALGGLVAHLGREAKHFQPSNAHFGLMPALNRRAPKKVRKELYAQRARETFREWLEAERPVG